VQDWPTTVIDAAAPEKVFARPGPVRVADPAALPGDILALGVTRCVARGGRILGRATGFEISDGRC
jgi:hypothetical protein